MCAAVTCKAPRREVLRQPKNTPSHVGPNISDLLLIRNESNFSLWIISVLIEGVTPQM